MRATSSRTLCARSLKVSQATCHPSGEPPSALWLRHSLPSNVAVARLIILGRRAGEARPGFVPIDLELRDPTALAVLAVIVTSTPGTAWMDYDAARGRLLLHVFDLVDEDEWRDIVNNRYGRLLKEIFS